MAEEQTYTAFDVAVLARELRGVAGVDEETFSRDKVVSMMRDEVILLRERGLSDDKIADILGGFDVPVKASELNDLISKPAWGPDAEES